MTLTTKEKDLITYYDLGECISEQIYYFVNDKQEFCVSILLDEDKNPNEITDKQIEEHFYNDYYYDQDLYTQTHTGICHTVIFMIFNLHLASYVVEM